MVGALGPRALAALTATIVLGGAPATAHADSRHCFEPPPVKPSGSGLQLTQVASAGTTTGVANAPGDSAHVYLSQRTGTVLALDPATGALSTFLDLSAEVAPTIEPAGNERGMQSIAFAPDYRSSRRLYVFYSDRKGDSRVDEFKATPDFQRADMATRRHVLLVHHSFSKQHYGGQLAFGSKHRLFVSLGEAEHARWAQRRRLYGELVSLDPLHARGGVRVIAKGFRNPFHFTFDPFTGSAVIGDVGETSREEIDVLPRSRFGRANFGWPYFEGNRRLFPWRHRKDYIRPALVYDHKVGAAVIGGTFIRDPRLPKLRGRYLYADLCDGWLALGRLHRKKPTTRLTGIVARAPSAIGEDSQHRIYIGGRDGAVYRLDPAGAGGPPCDCG
jgi:glucose/arabinose dehydrogenase